MAELNANALITLEELKLYLDINDKTEDTLLELFINNASDFIDRYCHRNLASAAYTLERYNGRGRELNLKNYPVTAIVQICQDTLPAIQVRYTDDSKYNAYVEIDQAAEELKLIQDGTTDLTIDLSLAANDTLAELVVAITAQANWEAEIVNTDYNDYPSSLLFTKLNLYCKNQWVNLEIPDTPIDDFDVDYDAGIINLPGSRFSRGFQNIYVSYTAGYTTIPGTLQQACLEMVQYKYNLPDKDLSVKSEQIGRVYQYTLGDMKKALPDFLLAEIESFRAVLV